MAGHHDTAADCPTWGPVRVGDTDTISFECRCRPAPRRMPVAAGCHMHEQTGGACCPNGVCFLGDDDATVADRDDFSEHQPVRCHPEHHCWAHCGSCGQTWPCTGAVREMYHDMYGVPVAELPRIRAKAVGTAESSLSPKRCIGCGSVDTVYENHKGQLFCCPCAMCCDTTEQKEAECRTSSASRHGPRTQGFLTRALRALRKR
ncbi:hypothetical protein ACFY7C_19455 [Streptomyces sp. NPDC012769]|uniref:hypothetical protein n=1 Tax=Streptomyces sp. NPDC012769 TaxID=3364848 RepID=UPI0036C2E40B